MSYPQAIIDQIVNHAEVWDEADPPVKLRDAYSETVEAHSVIEIELRSGQDYLVHIENVEAVLNELKHPVDADDKLLAPIGAEVGSWCIKTLDGKPVYGKLASEDPSGRTVCRLYQSQLDRLKGLASTIFRDKGGILLSDAATRGVT